MKKFLKFCITAAIVMLAVGFLLTAAISVIKGSDYLNNILWDMTDGKIGSFMENMERLEDGGRDILEDVEEGASELIDEVVEGYEGFEGYDINDAMMFDKGQTVESGSLEKTFENMNASKLKIEIGGCELEIVSSENDSARVFTDNVGNFQAYIKGDELCIKGTRKAREDAENCKITLYLPAGYAWKEAEVEVGAGAISMGEISASKVELEVGAGKITASAIKAGELDVSVGAGEIRLENMEVADLEAGVGMGNFAAQGTVTGNIEAECSMGNMTLQLSGAQSDYNYEVECVAGNINIGDDKYSAATAKEQKINNGAGKKMDLECSMGNIKVIFENE